MFNFLLILIFYRERSFGGDFWLHLWLIELQANSWTDFGAPALLASFSPVGTLSTTPLFSGGPIYAFAGALQAVGFSNYSAAITVTILTLNVTFFSLYVSLKRLGVSTLLLITLPFSPLAFVYTISDGFGRGSLSSMLAGLLSVATISLVVSSMREAVLSKRFIVLLGLLFFLSLTTHLPSAVILLSVGIPLTLLLLLTWKNIVVWKSIVAVSVSFATGLLISQVYLFPALIWASEASRQGLSENVFNLDASQYFRNPAHQWSFFPSIPEEHKLFWSQYTLEGTWTTFSTTFPTLLFLILVFGLIVMSHRSKKALFIGPSIALCIILLMITAPEIWTFLPHFMQSLQYSYRLSYLLIPFLTILLALVSSNLQKKKTTLFSALVFVAIIALSLQNLSQLSRTENLSIVAGDKNFLMYESDVPPSQKNVVSDPFYFWYSSEEQQSIDSIKNDSISTKCQLINSTNLWTFYPGQQILSFEVEQKCASISMIVPVSWLEFKNIKSVYRDPETLNLHLQVDSQHRPVEIKVKVGSPIGIGFLTSSLGIILLLAVLCSGVNNKRRAQRLWTPKWRKRRF
jgi:hypothetical protein